MNLLGFDSYEVTLGDEMRGERASIGKSLDDAERDMRIKARIITAIEDCDLAGFPNQSVIAGYVRSYARYLGMDPDECFRRFCDESGYASPTALRHMPASNACGTNLAGGDLLSDPLSRSRFAMAAPSAFRPRVSLGALSSAVALIGLIGGLSYGGYALLQDIQRVGFAPLPEAPAVIADAPLIQAPEVDTASIARPEPGDFEGGGALAAFIVPTELPNVGQVERDGPISAIDPARAGVFDVDQVQAMTARATRDPMRRLAEVSGVGTATAEPDARAPSQAAEQGVTLIASEEAWVRIREGNDTVLYQGMLRAGDRYDLPNRLVDPVLRAGNAGGIFVVVDGVTYGPIGQRGRVVSGVSLRASDVRASIPEAQPADIHPVLAVPGEQRAEASSLR